MPALPSPRTSWRAASVSPRQIWLRPHWGCSPPEGRHDSRGCSWATCHTILLNAMSVSIVGSRKILQSTRPSFNNTFTSTLTVFKTPVSTDLVEVVSYDLPNARPLQPDAVHVVVGDLHDLLQAEHPRLVRRGQLVHGHRAQPPHKVHWRRSETETRDEERRFH